MRWGGLYDHGPVRCGAREQRRCFAVMHTPAAVRGTRPHSTRPPRKHPGWLVWGVTRPHALSVWAYKTHTRLTGSTTPVNTYSELYTCPLLHPLPRAHGLNRSNFSASVSSADVYRGPPSLSVRVDRVYYTVAHSYPIV